MAADDLDSIFILSVSQEAYEELQTLRDQLMQQTYDDKSKDTWVYQWGCTTYSPNKFYKIVFQNVPAHPSFSWMWKSKCTSRVKFFAWLILVDRLNTKTMLRRRNLYVDDEVHYVLCNEGADEDIDHLFLNCPFAKRYWEKIGIHWNTDLSLYPRLAHAIDSSRTLCSLWKWRSWQPGRSGRLGMIEFSEMVGSMSIAGLGILKTSAYFNLYVLLMT